MASGLYLIILTTATIAVTVLCFEVFENQTMRSKRVADSEPVIHHSKPYMAAIYSDTNRFRCGAFLINRPPNLFDHVANGSSDIVLTAAHCVVHVADHLLGHPIFMLEEINQMHVVFGKHSTRIEDQHQVIIAIEKVFVHAEYQGYKHHNDIAIIKLLHAVSFNDFIKPIPLAKTYLMPQVCTVSGWGSDYSVEARNITLSMAELLQNFTRNGMVASSPVKGRIANGDSGSALVCVEDNREVAYGIVSMTVIETEYATSIVNFLPWINSTLALVEKPGHYDNLVLGKYNLDRVDDTEFWLQLLNFQFIALFGVSSTVFHDVIDYGKYEADELMSRDQAIGKILIHENHYCLHGIFASYLVKDIHACIALVYVNNASLCTYLSGPKQCLLSSSQFDQKYCAVIPDPKICPEFEFGRFPPLLHEYCSRIVGRGRSIVVQLDKKEAASSAHVFNTEAIDEVPTGTWQDGFHKFPMISVYESFSRVTMHCLASLFSTDGVFFDQIIASSKCLEQLVGLDPLKTEFRVEIALNNLTEYQLISTQFNSSGEPGLVVSNLEKKIKNDRKPYTQSVGKYDLKPTIKDFFLGEGAFLAKTNAFASIARVDEKNLCGAILLNETEFIVNGRRDRSKFLLTSNECAKYEEEGDLIGGIGSYFCDLQSSSHQSLYMKKRSVSTDTYGLVIIELQKDIVFNRRVQPISVYKSNQRNHSDVFIAANECTQLEVPVEVELDEHGNFTKLNKIYYRNPKGSRFRFASPILACNNDRDKCTALGFACRQFLIQNGRSFVKNFNIPIESYLEWINATLNANA